MRTPKKKTKTPKKTKSKSKDIKYKKSIILDPDIYEEAKDIVYSQYTKPSAYRSGALVKKYKELGGRYKGEYKKTPLKRWFDEKWTDVNPMKNEDSYPVYRPTVKVSRYTPLTLKEVDPKDLKRKAKLKQKIRENKLPPFQSK